MKTIQIKKGKMPLRLVFFGLGYRTVSLLQVVRMPVVLNFNSKLGHKEFIVSPILRIGLNVIRNSLKRIVVADYVIVKTRLPGKIRMNLSRIKDTSAFILVDDDA